MVVRGTRAPAATLFAALVCGPLMACAAPGAPPAPAASSPHAGARDREALIRADRAFSALSASKGVAEAFFGTMTDETVQLPVGGDPIIGREAIRRSLAAGPAFTLTWEPRDGEVALSGELGYTWGTYEAAVTAADGTVRVSHGKYVTIWKKQPDGAWKAILDIGNPGPDPAPPPREGGR